MNDGMILLVEDDPDDVALTLRAFQKNGIRNEVVVVTDGEEALRFLRADPAARPLPALILLDINLPKIRGLDVLRSLRADERTRYLPVVVHTTSNEERDIARGYELGANSYVRKPVDFEQFLESVRLLGLYWLLVNEPMPGPAGADG